jgi:hypothetical protein
MFIAQNVEWLRAIASLSSETQDKLSPLHSHTHCATTSPITLICGAASKFQPT